MKQKKSGPQVFMYIVIGISAALSAVCLGLYYGKYVHSGALLWTGVTSFMVMYHLWSRIIMGNVTKLFRVKHTHAWFREKPFERRLYRTLKVRSWKGRTLTYNPDHFSLESRSLPEIVEATVKAELDHWVNEGLSLLSILFALLWGETWIFVLTALFAMLFDGQFILIQRYNRPRLLRLIARKREKIPLRGVAKEFSS